MSRLPVEARESLGEHKLDTAFRTIVNLDDPAHQTENTDPTDVAEERSLRRLVTTALFSRFVKKYK